MRRHLIHRLWKGVQKMSDKILHRSIAGGVLCLAFATGYAGTASAAEYTAQELANIAIVRALYTQLDAADARGDTRTAIRDREKLFQEYQQRMAGRPHTFTAFYGK
jgi:hypothetical protein